MARASYGVDAPPALFGLASGSVLLLAATIASAIGSGWWALIPGVMTLYFVTSTSLYVHTTRRGKLEVWRDVLDTLAPRGDERALDLGCGRGAVLIAVAKRLPAGRATGA